MAIATDLANPLLVVWERGRWQSPKSLLLNFEELLAYMLLSRSMDPRIGDILLPLKQVLVLKV